MGRVSRLPKVALAAPWFRNGRSRSATVSFVVMALNDCPGPSIWVVSDICRIRIRPYSGWLASALTAMYAARLDRLSGTYELVREKIGFSSRGHFTDR